MAGHLRTSSWAWRGGGPGGGVGVLVGWVAGAGVGDAEVVSGWVEKMYQPSDAALANPERGLYVQFTARGQGPPLEAGALAELREGQGVTLVLRMYYLNEFRDRPIDAARLGLMAKDFEAMREAGVKCLLRFAYNEKIGEADAPIEMVLGHMEQLEPVLKKNADVIAVAQAGFVGSWGEWHASTNDLREPENARRIIEKWLEVLPASRCVQVRTPGIKQMLTGAGEAIKEGEAFSEALVARVGHHNDCFLATFNDMGTYEDVDAEKAYLAQETRWLPMGGETCHVSEFVAADNAKKEFARFHWSYLNVGYHPEVIAGWREAGFFEEVERRLGYRLVLNKAGVSSHAAAGSAVRVEMELSNAGWAAPFNPREVELVLQGAEGRVYYAALDVDPRRWQAGEAVAVSAALALPGAMEAGGYDLFLWLPDPEPALRERPAYAVRLANEGLWEPVTGWVVLGLSVEVGPAAGGEAEDSVVESEGAFVRRVSQG